MDYSTRWQGKTFTEDNIKPRPLRIIKRECNTVSDFSFARKSSASHDFQEFTARSQPGYDIEDMDNNVSSGRRGSAEFRQAPVPNSNAKREVSPISKIPSQARNVLHVPKQRRTNHCTTRLSSVLGSFVGDTSSYASARIRDKSARPSASKTMGQNSGACDSVQAIAPVSRRAATSGALDNEHSLYPSTDGLALPPGPKQFPTSKRSRAVTTDCVVRGSSDLAALQHHSLPRSRVQPSLRHRLFSRVMHGVAGKPNVSHAALEREAVARGLHANNVGNVEPIRSAAIGRPRPASSSSVETASTFTGDIDLALAAFPTPPKSTVTSPTTISSFETSRAGFVASRLCSRPPNVAVPSVQLNVIPEVDKLSVGDGQTLFVAVEITGDVGVIDQPCDTAPQAKALDVAIVIDSSLFTSPAALIASCEAARFIASQLNPAMDRLAVLSTRPQRTDAPDLNIVSPLSPTSIRQIKSAVDSIVSSTEKPEPAALATALNCAIDLLTDAATQAVGSEPLEDAYGHLFVLTGNIHGISPILLDHGKLSVHVVCPGSVPWRGANEVPCDGWRLGALYSSPLQSMSLRKDVDQGSLFNRLRRIIILARSGRVCGRLTDLVLDIQAGPACSIEGVMGSSDVARLCPGEVTTALVKVRVGAAFMGSFTPSHSMQQLSSTDSASSSDLLNELEAMLCTSSAPILIAKLTYRHSLLPTGTRCSTIAAAKLKRSMSDVRSDSSLIRTMKSRATENRAAVQKRLIHHLATHHAPRHAILTLQEHFGEDGRKSLCPDYIKLVITELKYQARVTERFDLPVSTRISPSVSRNISLTNTYEHFGQGLFAASNYRPQDWLPGAIDEEASSRHSGKTSSTDRTPKRAHGDSGHRKATVLRTGSVRQPISRPSARQAGVLPTANRRNSSAFQATSKGIGAEARGLSSDKGKISSSDSSSINLGRPSGVSGLTPMERSRGPKELTLRHKGTVGADSLMSRHDRGIARAKENVAPRLRVPGDTELLQDVPAVR